jgi:hypothetical protein
MRRVRKQETCVECLRALARSARSRQPPSADYVCSSCGAKGWYRVSIATLREQIKTARNPSGIADGVTLDLDAIFVEFNTRYFDGRLRRVKTRWTDNSEGNLKNKSSGCYSPRLRTIFMDRKLRGDQRAVESMMIHEMAHIGTDGFHGKRFVTKLKTLLEKGAPINADDRIRLVELFGPSVFRTSATKSNPG